MKKLKSPKEIFGDYSKQASDTRNRRSMIKYIDENYYDDLPAWNYLMEKADLLYPDAYPDSEPSKRALEYNPESGTWYFLK